MSGANQFKRRRGNATDPRLNSSTTVPARQPTDAEVQKRKQTTAISAAKAVMEASVGFAARHPTLMKRYALPLALTTLSKPLLSVLPFGPFGPILAFVAVACGRFKMRQQLVGGGYALLHAAGMAGYKGQALSLLGLVGLEATGAQKLRDTCVKSLLESNVGVRTQVIGLVIAVLSSSTGTFGALGSVLGARSMGLLFSELRSFAAFHGLKWAATNLQGLWLMFSTSSDAVKASFLRHVLRQENNNKKVNVNVDDQKRMQWARDTLGQIAAKIPQFPVEAVAPELAAILKAWDLHKEPPVANHEALGEWVKVGWDDTNLWASISYDENEQMASSTTDLVAYADRATFEDFSHRHSRSENVQCLEQVARETFEKLGMSEKHICAALDEMGLGDPTAPWRMEVEELESEPKDVFVSDVEEMELGDPMAPWRREVEEREIDGKNGSVTDVDDFEVIGFDEL